MTYVITEPCIGEKDNSCVEVCPVDCIHPTPEEPDYEAHEQLYIDADECIDCDACVEACPVDAIYAQEQVPPEWERFTALNAALLQGHPWLNRTSLSAGSASKAGGRSAATARSASWR